MSEGPPPNQWLLQSWNSVQFQALLTGNFFTGKFLFSRVLVLCKGRVQLGTETQPIVYVYAHSRPDLHHWLLSALSCWKMVFAVMTTAKTDFTRPSYSIFIPTTQPSWKAYISLRCEILPRHPIPATIWLHCRRWGTVYSSGLWILFQIFAILSTARREPASSPKTEGYDHFLHLRTCIAHGSISLPQKW